MSTMLMQKRLRVLGAQETPQKVYYGGCGNNGESLVEATIASCTDAIVPLVTVKFLFN